MVQSKLNEQQPLWEIGFIKWARRFIVSAGIILLFTGAAKEVSSFGTVRILDSLDPVFAISFRRVFQIVGTLEIVVAIICFFDKHIRIQLGLLAWLATNFVFYRLGLLLTHYNRPCPCLGNLTDPLHIRPETANNAMLIILLYFMAGSYGMLLYSNWIRRQTINPQAVC